MQTTQVLRPWLVLNKLVWTVKILQISQEAKNKDFLDQLQLTVFRHIWLLLNQEADRTFQFHHLQMIRESKMCSWIKEANKSLMHSILELWYKPVWVSFLLQPQVPQAHQNLLLPRVPPLPLHLYPSTIYQSFFNISVVSLTCYINVQNYMDGEKAKSVFQPKH